jgi:NitT/TauT family transport system permease protein
MTNTKWLQAGAPIAVGIAFIVLWHALVVVNEVPPHIVPSPFLVMKTLVQDWGLLSGSLLVTLQVTGAALALAVVLGVALSILFVQSRLIEASLLPHAVILQVTALAKLSLRRWHESELPQEP